ncbi:MAG: hypothetical protein KW793_03265 [Candidatus Doudnabacteria bacterium]|nr:hypothetical protein [Candidatus Doudnabacteria bacterium]
MPVPPGASYAATGTVTAFTSTNAQLGSDSSSATITIDNLSPANVSGESASPDDQQVDLDWTNPADSDFSQLIILKNTSSISDAPVEGASYSVSDTIGSSTVIYVGSGTSLNDSGLVNDIVYYYKIFTKDASGNYSTGAQLSATPSLTPTTIITTGTDPASFSVSPGESVYLDQFTFKTNTGTDTVTDLVVTTSGTSSIVDMAIFSNDLSTQYFGLVPSPAGNNWSFSGGTPIPVTSTIASFRIIITAKARVDLTPGSYPITGSVSSFTSTNQQSGLDGAGATVTIDMQASSPVTAASGNAGNTAVSLSWTNPTDADFKSAVVLRKTSVVNDSPTSGSGYIVGDTIGSSTVVCVTSSTSCSSTGLINDTAYHYKIFAVDNFDNYSTGVVPTGSPFTPTFVATTTISDGSALPDADLAPGAPITDLDTFGLTTDIATDSITALTVTLASGTYAGIEDIRVTSDDGLTLYFAAVASLSANTVNFTGGIPILATTTPTQYKLRITPKSHPDMDVPPGEEYAITGTVTSFTSTNVQEGSDSSSATITLDNLSPANTTSASGTASETQVSLTWTNPNDSDFNSVIIFRSLAAVVDAPSEGSTSLVTDIIGASTVVYFSNGDSFIDVGLTNGITYYYKIFARDNNANYSTGVVPTGSPFTPSIASTNSSGSSSGANNTPAPILTPTPVVVDPPTVVEEPKPSIPPQTNTPELTAPTQPATETPEVVPPAVNETVPDSDAGPGNIERTTDITDTISNILDKAETAIENAVDSAKDAVVNIGLRIADAFNSAIDNTVDGTAAVHRSIGEFTNKVAGALNNYIDRGHEATVAVTQKVAEGLDAAGRNIALVWNSAKDTIASAGHDLSLVARSTWDGITGAVDSSVQFVARGWESATDKFVKLGKNDNQVPEEVATKEPRVVFHSGAMELVADQESPIQAIVGFNFKAEITPHEKASSIGGTYKYTDVNGDGIWEANVRMPDITGRFNVSTEIAYASGRNSKHLTEILIDPEGYVFENHPRGEIRINQAEVKLWTKSGNDWILWPAANYNQINPQITNNTGIYSYLAPAGDYYLEVIAERYAHYKSDVFNLSTVSPIHKSIELQYTGD